MPPTSPLRTLPLRLARPSTPHHPSTLPRCHPLPTHRRTLLTASSSPTIEAAWLTKHSRNHRGGAAFAAKQSPRAQLVAAEEGLNTWLDTTPSTRKVPERVPFQIASRTEEAPMPWNSIPESPAITTPVIRRQRSPYTHPAMGPGTADAARDDTPGLIAFSAFLLLPLAFQLGRYFEGRENSGAAAPAEGVDGVDRLGQSGLGDLLWTAKWSPLATVREVPVQEMRVEEGRRGWFWAV